MDGLEEAVIHFWNEGLTTQTILWKLGLNDENKERIENIIKTTAQRFIKCKVEEE